ncbi:MAG: S-adenosylmethionine:tRNA ribosyltransferase-isomerase [Bacteroidia bacterium]
MTNPKSIHIRDYTYHLPEDRIAQHPLEQRDHSRLLLYKNGNIEDHHFYDLPALLPSGAILIYNNTRVVRARLILNRSTGAAVEIFCTDASDPSTDFILTLQQQKSVDIRAFVGNGKKWKEGELLQVSIPFQDGDAELTAERIGIMGDQSVVSLSWTPEDLTFSEVLELYGKMPLPPYMKRDEEEEDAERYQTVYAEEKGSVAAPTAGLHFTERVLNELRERNIRTATVTLHVGAGTFKPVKADQMEDHEMHREKIIVPFHIIELLLKKKNDPVVAVGTTSLRTLESIYWFGKQLSIQPGRYRDELFVDQWEPYNGTPDVPLSVAMQAIYDWMIEYNKKELSGYTQLLIAPGYRFKVADMLITNFHQPESTLLLLVSAFTGNDFKKIYDHALNNNYRFLSYGDSSLLYRNQQ